MSRRPRLRNAALLHLPALLLLGAAPASLALDVQVESDTILRYFERDTRKGEGQAVLPAYEYLRVAAGQLEGKGLSAHAYGWGRTDLAGNEFFDDRSQGELLYGYLQYSHARANLTARAGRMVLFEGVANESVDGVSLRADLTSIFALSLYGGLPVALEEVDGRSGDRIWGGRLGHHWADWYELGVSYKRVADDGDRQEEALGIDSSLNLPWPLALHGLSVRNLGTDQWQEHAYEAQARLGGFLLRPYFERFVYDALFDTGANTASPFRFLGDATETITVIGADLAWHPTGRIELALKAKNYDYRERSDDAWYYAALATVRIRGLSQVGAELGVMDGDTDDTRYSLWRGWFYWDRKPAFASGDVVYVGYDADILGEDRSIFASLAAGVRLLEEALEVKLSGDYSADPYFDHDLRGLLAVTYRFSR